ncbi:substrate-binding domain-containing protein [Clostridium carnis]
MIRQSDIAKKLNISRTTVARALNGTGSINPETKEKILKACEELGYKRNPISTSLASKRKKNIFAFIVKTRNHYYIEGIRLGFKEAEIEYKFYKYQINIIETDINNPEEQVQMLRTIIKKGNVDGIIITPLLKEEIKAIKKDNPKIVFMALDLPLDRGTYSVYSNYYKVGRITANILLSVLNNGDKILVINTEDDRISSRLSFDGFYSKLLEEKKCRIVGPIYQKDLKNNIEKVVEENVTDDINALYSSRFLVDIVEYISSNKNINLKVIDNGFSKATKELIRKNKIIATVVQKYEELGYLASKNMFEYLYKDSKPKNINNEIDSIIIFKENLERNVISRGINTKSK